MTDRNGAEYKASTLECKLFYTLQSHTGSFFVFKRLLYLSKYFPYHQTITLTSKDTVSPIPDRQHFSSGSSFLLRVSIPNFTTLPLSVFFYLFNSLVKIIKGTSKHLYGLRHFQNFHPLIMEHIVCKYEISNMDTINLRWLKILRFTSVTAKERNCLIGSGKTAFNHYF